MFIEEKPYVPSYDPSLTTQVSFSRRKPINRQLFIRCLLMMPLGPHLLRATHPEFFLPSENNGQLRKQ